MISPLVVMPTYNESSSLEPAVHELASLREQNLLHGMHLLIVDDNSPDGTGLIADELAKSFPWVHVLHRQKKTGLGGAYLAGFEWALQQTFSHIVEMDADGSHRAKDLVSLLGRANEADLVIGSRWVAGGEVLNWPGYRKAISRIGNTYAKFMLRSQVNDMTAGFRIYSANLLRRLNLDGIAAHGYGFQVEMAWRAEKLGATVLEVPITFVERTVGRSKMTYGIVIEALLLVTIWGLNPKRRR